MATLIHKTTGQVMDDIANVEQFLGAVTDPEQWEMQGAADVAPAEAVPTTEVSQSAPASAVTEPVSEAPEVVVAEDNAEADPAPDPAVEQATQETAAPAESVLAHAVHVVEAELETLLHKIEGDNND